METDAGEIGELVGTPRTLDGLPGMNGGFQVLFEEAVSDPESLVQVMIWMAFLPD